MLPMAAAPATTSSRRRWLIAVVAIVLVVAAYVTDRVLVRVPWHEVFAHIRETPPRMLLLAVLLTTGSYLALTLFDALGLRAVGAKLHWRAILATAFPAFAVGHNIGFAALSGGSIRLRWYSRAGLSTWQVGQVIAFCSFTSLLGAATLCGLSLLGSASLAGQVLHIGQPGGIGVFETVLLLLLPDRPVEEKLAALLIYRAIYYLLPFALALSWLAVREAWVGRNALARGTAWARAWLRLGVPQLITAVVFAGGLLLLFSGATPAEHDRLHLLREVLPLSLVETSHLLGSAVGISLVLLAQGLQRRLDAAWHVTLWLLGIGIIASLAKGLDFEEATVLAIMALLLLAAKDRFQRKASLLQEPFSKGWIIAVLAALISSLCLAWLSYRDVEYSNQMWWHFALHADAPRSLRAMVLTTMLTGLAAAWLLLRPARHLPRPPQVEELERARVIIEQSGDTAAWLAMLGDKNLLFSDDGRGFVMYRPVGRNWIAMGDPVGPPEVRRELLWRFREACDRYAARPVFYQACVDDLPDYIDAGFVLSKIGEEARVPLANFSLDGPQRADLRQGWRRLQRQEVYFEMLSPEQVAKQIDGLRAVSDAWLEELSTAEKGFSLGRFDDAYIKRFHCAVVKRDGAIVAFANLWLGANHGELSVDLMRYLPHAPKGVMDYLMVEIMLWGTAQGYAWFNLGMAPLSGLADREFAPLWSRVGAFLYSHGERFYNFEGLRSY
jgi:phosphatidylglycerol lysyltransferase